MYPILVSIFFSTRQDMWGLEAFCGLYKCAAILHFPVSAVPAESILTDCGGSGRGLPADARLHIFLHFFFHISKCFLLHGIRVDGVAVLTRVGFNIQTVGSAQFLPLFVSGWAGMEPVVVCGPTGEWWCCCCFHSRYLGYASHRLRGKHTYIIDDTHWVYHSAFGTTDYG